MLNCSETSDNLTTSYFHHVDIIDYQLSSLLCCAFWCFLVLFNDFILHHVDTIVCQLRGGPRPQLYPKLNTKNSSR